MDTFRKSFVPLVLLAAGALVLLLSPTATSGSHGGAWHNVDTANRDANGVQDPEFVDISERHSISQDGQFVVFTTYTNLSPDDTNDDGDVEDVYVKDMQTGAVDFISASSAGVPGNDHSGSPSISRNARFVVFESDATNLVSGDSNGEEDLFLHDRQTGQTTRVSVKNNGSQSSEYPGDYNGAVSDDGMRVVFDSYQTDLVSGDTNDDRDVFLRDLSAGTTTRLSTTAAGAQIDFGGDDVDISANGRYVAFASSSTDIGDADTTSESDVFLKDLMTGGLEHISVDPPGAQSDDRFFGPRMSADARFIAYYGLADVWVHDTMTAETVNVTPGAAAMASGFPQVSDDGRFVSYHSFESNGSTLVWDRNTAQSERVNVAPDGGTPDAITFGYASLSGNGMALVYDSTAKNLLPDEDTQFGDAFYATRESGGPTNSATLSPTAPPTVSPTASSGPPPDPPWGPAEMVSVTSSEVPAEGNSWTHALSDDGRFVVFESDAQNLVPGDMDLPDDFDPDRNFRDVFVRDRQNGTTTMVSTDSSGAVTGELTELPAISGDGNFVAMSTWDRDLIGASEFVLEQVVVKNLLTGEVELISRAPNGDYAENGINSHPALSLNGRYVAFMSNATNLAGTPPDCEFGRCDEILLYDRQTQQMQMVSVSSSEQAGNGNSFGYPAISDDGMFVAFNSLSTNLAANDTNPGCEGAGVTGDCYDIFRRDVSAGTTALVSVATNGMSANGYSTFPDMSGDGRYVVFSSFANNLVADDDNVFCDTDFDQQEDDNCADIFLRDMLTGTTTLVSRNFSGDAAHGASGDPAISKDGRYIAFRSVAPDVVAGHDRCEVNQPQGELRVVCNDIYVYDRETGEMSVVSRTSDGFPPNETSFSPAINGDGSVVSFNSYASDLDPNDTVICDDLYGVHNCYDVFAAERDDTTPTPTPTLSPTPTQSAPPTAPPGSQIWGDGDCSNSVAPRDGQGVLNVFLGKPPLTQTEPCPDIDASLSVTATSRKWGDWDCSGAVGPRDGQSALNVFLSKPPLTQTEPCPDIGTTVTFGDSTSTPTVTPTDTPVPTQATVTDPPTTSTNTATPPASSTKTPTPTASPTKTPTPSPTRSPTPSPTATPLSPTNVCPSTGIPGFPADINDNDANNPVVVGFDVPDGASTIADLEICVDIDHTRVGDLIVSLHHYVGNETRSATLINGAVSGGSCTGNNMRVLFDEEAASRAQDACGNGTPALSGTYRGVSTLDVFNGDSASGDWELWIYDVTPGETGAVRGSYIWWNYD